MNNWRMAQRANRLLAANNSKLLGRSHGSPRSLERSQPFFLRRRLFAIFAQSGKEPSVSGLVVSRLHKDEVQSSPIGSSWEHELGSARGRVSPPFYPNPPGPFDLLLRRPCKAIPASG
jgi:hypothetical protein